MSIKAPKKLIEVALPLDDINIASAREKSIRHGHPSTLHLWWARRPLAAARAVLFAQMVNDPGGERGYFAGKTKAKADAEREKLFQIIRDLVKWENSNNEEILERARIEIRNSWRETCALNKGEPGYDPDKPPAFHDPFAGGGTIPLEAQRLGLESYASDLNPVAVLINKAMIEIPPKFAALKPIGPISNSNRQREMHEDWSGARGLAEDVRRYGEWMRVQAESRIGHLYPKVGITDEMGADRPDLKQYIGDELTVIAWIWARTVRSPNPAFAHVEVPLSSSFVLSRKVGREAWVEPIIEGDTYRFVLRIGNPPASAAAGTKVSQGAFKCLFSGSPIRYDYVDDEAKAGRMGTCLMAIVAEGKRGRVYLDPTDAQLAVARSARPTWKPETPCRGTFGSNAQGRRYGFNVFGDYFTARQLVALTTFSDLACEVREKVAADAKSMGLDDDGVGLESGGSGATAYGDAVAVYLSLVASRQANYMSSLCVWSSHPKDELAKQVFLRQGIAMTWDFAETNPFCNSGGTIDGNVSYVSNCIERFVANALGSAEQANVVDAELEGKVISTDPPYFDNVGYADLSDFFYAWLRRGAKPIFPALFSTLSVPKAEELIVAVHRHGSKDLAELFFMEGMTDALGNIARKSHPAFPITIYYAFKQSETDDKNGTSSNGWETFLAAVLKAGLTICGTWPVRTELIGNLKKVVNALASSIVLVCRVRAANAPIVSRRDFQRQLREQLPDALKTMIGGSNGLSPVAPVDLAQAAIGPGMAIFSEYAAVLNQDGSHMDVHDALILINREITDFLTPDSGGFDADTLFCNSWFEEYGWGAGPFGDAEVLSRGKGTSVPGVTEAGVVESGGGKVRLLRWAEYEAGWDPKADKRNPVWESAHQLIRALNQQGESEAGALLATMPNKAEPIRQLAYHLYTLCERKKWAEDARVYNELITAWHAIVSASYETGHRDTQLGINV